MCEWNQVEYSCGHIRYTVRSWCKYEKHSGRLVKLKLAGSKYPDTHVRCPVIVVAVVYELGRKCGQSASIPVLFLRRLTP